MRKRTVLDRVTVLESDLRNRVIAGILLRSPHSFDGFLCVSLLAFVYINIFGNGLSKMCKAGFNNDYILKESVKLLNFLNTKFIC